MESLAQGGEIRTSSIECYARLLGPFVGNFHTVLSKTSSVIPRCLSDSAVVLVRRLHSRAQLSFSSAIAFHSTFEQDGLDGMAPTQTDELFVKQVEVYKRARPRCPEALFAFLASLTPSHELAWDVGTGNGQAAAVISKHFRKVIATDVAGEQLQHAEPRPNVTYAVTPGTLTKDELARIVGPEGSVDLVLIVEALHWLNFDTFYDNVKHVLRKPGGVIAATVYPSRPKVEASVDRVVDEFYATIEHYWTPQVLEYVETGYKTIPFPFALKTGCPLFEVTVDANLDEFLAYLESWSAVQTAMDHGEEPLSAHQRKLFADAWGSPGTVRCLKWPLDVLVGTV